LTHSAEAGRYGKTLMELYSAFKSAGSEVNERILKIEISWTKTRLQIETLSQIWPSLDAEHQFQQSQILDTLVSKLQAAIAQVERVQKKKYGKGDEIEINRVKYAMIKESIDKASIQATNSNHETTLLTVTLRSTGDKRVARLAGYLQPVMVSHAEDDESYHRPRIGETGW
jgi:LPS O-antigen subunit length determinant protein (WzzB/FepE family)